MLETMPATTRKHLIKANAENANLIVRTAKVLVPVGKTGRAKALIKTKPQGDGQLIDFGPLSAILEGGTAPRQTKTGANRGVGPKRAFVGPSMTATYKTRRKTTSKAVTAAIKEAKANG